MNELIEQVKKWSKDKGLDQADSKAQFTKSVEEMGEIASALCRNDTEALRDGIGDVIVTLVILAQQNNMTIYECLSTAYEEIKNRKGKMVNGTFVKSDDFR